MASLPHCTPVLGDLPRGLGLGGGTWALLPGRTLPLLVQAFPKVHLDLVVLELPLLDPYVLARELDLVHFGWAGFVAGLGGW